jgi:ABC-type transporter Mla maintaining outer membrane lipid asymmetry ATPase subunit MlaF
VAAPVLTARRLVPGTLPPGHVTAAHALDLSLQRGTITCMVGPQGGGKSHYLRALAAVDPPASGDLTIVGRYLSNLDPKVWRALRPTIAYIGPSAPLLSILNGIANVTLPAYYHRIGSTEQIRAAADAILQRIGFDGPRDVLPAYLDDHQRRLLALARCLILKPQTLFIDEPFRMTDLGGLQDFGDVFVRLAREDHLAQVIVTHHLSFAARHADQILFVTRDGVQVYGGWSEFAASDDPQARSYLDETTAGQRVGAP